MRQGSGPVLAVAVIESSPPAVRTAVGSGRWISYVILAAFLGTFLTALPRIYRQLPGILARRSLPWETLRRQNHGFYCILQPVIREVSQRVSAHGIVLVENFHRTEHQFLANYLAPIRLFFVNTPELGAQDSDSTPVWVLTLGEVVEGRQHYTLVRWRNRESVKP